MVGKTPDQFAPLGPHLVTADQINLDNLKIECRVVKGDLRQSSNADDFIFNRAQIVSYISRHFTLKPGDIIFTGTPEGVIMGNPKEKQVWLKAGDQIQCSVEKPGVLRLI
jgi:2-keto-4-pentenoate hydratase/2-oxohepta-3-ene-1,7-dioic acid hydratase in catechol pathway